MSLDVNLRACAPDCPLRNNPQQQFEFGVLLCALGLAGLTAENWREFVARTDFYFRLHGWADVEEHLARYRQYLGVKVNGAVEPRGAWVRRMATLTFNDLAYARQRKENNQ